MTTRLDEENVACVRDYWRALQGEAAYSPGKDQEAFHDKWARKADRETQDAPQDKKVDDILEFLGSAGFEPEGSRVLDVGSGYGRLTLPLARLGAEVTALDISAGLLEHIERKARKERLTSIETLHASWHDIDLASNGLRKKFDLVIASMTPAVKDERTLDRMTEASRGICLYNGSLKRRWDRAYYDLYRALFGEEFKDGGTSLHVPFLYLYASGYRPLIRLYKDEWSHDIPVDVMAEMVYDIFFLYKSPGEEAKAAIVNYLAREAGNGPYRARGCDHDGMLAWRIME